MAHVMRELGAAKIVFSPDDEGKGRGAVEFADGVLISFNGDETPELRNILAEELPEFLELFIRKNAEYGENAQTLGPKGQFADLWRKVGKLKTGLWDGHEERLTSEGVDEILRDLIGHCLLTLQLRSREREMSRSWAGRDSVIGRIEDGR